ncbi:coenzyme F420-0:L-glutamate ligase [Vibrio hippocampi]|uniref:Bifunctional F420 biosynthesis protein FbiB n=1 Tax=Vibrio hippocampi TaxID=654686 RepID=A0ABN8DMY9_9VIBR|nr:coenzyme F420-0:L-glutamate ligase [Vibrio hippocampi]CAH0529139.1 Bifunctional F420 biosynthesis protein FbiB [Vibrio hippocampi]
MSEVAVKPFTNKLSTLQQSTLEQPTLKQSTLRSSTLEASTVKQSTLQPSAVKQSEPQQVSDSMHMFTLQGLPDFYPGMDLGAHMIDTLNKQGVQLQQGDILVVAHKVVSKCEGAVVDIEQMTASQQAIELAQTVNKDPRKVQVILDQSTRIVRSIKRPEQQEGVLIAEHKLGFICANAAVDESNTDQQGQLITLPENPDRSAVALCQQLEAYFDCQLGVVVSDTFGRPWRLGQTNVAIGLAKVPAVQEMFGEGDAWGRTLKVTAPAFADELAAASGLLMGKSGKCPVIIFRGLNWQATASSAQQILRPIKEDLFR